jgi:hypothetical protein
MAREDSLQHKLSQNIICADREMEAGGWEW